MSTSLLQGALAALCLALSVGTAACGQEGKVAVGGAGGASGGSGGSGGAGATGGTGGAGPGGAANAVPLKVLNWNLHNFFDTKKDSASPDEQVLTKADYDTKVAQIGQVLHDMDPDLAVLPEIENQAILDDVNKKQLGSAYNTAITLSNDFRGLDVGILSKLPIEKVVTHVMDTFQRLDLVGGSPYTYSRDAVEVHVTFNTRKIVLIGVHYRSKGVGTPESDDPDKRAAEAQHSRAIADELGKADPALGIVILGDYNDVPGSVPVSWSEDGNPKSDVKVTFSSAGDNIAAADRYSFVYNGKKELIDHQIMNPVMAALLDPKSVTIRHDKPVQDASDHHPLMATYRVQ